MTETTSHTAVLHEHRDDVHHHVHARTFHTFLFRHCVRSTKKKVKLHNGDESASKHASAYTKADLPDWNTPSEWCTETAIDTVQATGRFLLEKVVRRAGSAPKRISVRIISDTSQRDIDTSLALSLGMANYSRRFTDLQVDGLDELHLDHILFDPLDKEADPSTPRCAAFFSQTQTISDIKRRMELIPPPQQSFQAILKFFEKMGGVGHAGSLFSIEPPSTMYLNHTTMVLAGAINVVKLFGEMMFYSRAGGIDPPFLRKATVDDVYQALEWVHWYRTVIHLDNVEAATQGAVVTNAILESLEGGHYRGDACADEYEACVTIFVGHDSSIDAVATALGLRWKLKSPYRSGGDTIGEYVPTPPGGAMYFAHEEGSNTLEMAYMYPVYSEYPTKKTSFKLNNTGVLESVPMFLKLPIDTTISTGLSDVSTVVSFLDSFPYGMRARMNAVVATFPGASDCYRDIVEHTTTDLTQNQVSSKLGDNQFCIGTIVGTVFLTVSLMLCTLFAAKREKSAANQIVYSNDLAEGHDHLELT